MFTRGLAAGLAATLLGCCAAAASVEVRIDKSSQRMTVSVNGAPTYAWPVSTGRAGYGTPNGRFRPQRMHRTWFSRAYYNSPMPHSIFYHGGYAIHGTNDIRRLGGPASHGCVRLHPGNAATLFALVRRHGMPNTRIIITGSNPARSGRSKRPRSRPAPRATPRPAVRYAPEYRLRYQEPRYYYYEGPAGLY